MGIPSILKTPTPHHQSLWWTFPWAPPSPALPLKGFGGLRSLPAPLNPPLARPGPPGPPYPGPPDRP